MNDTELSARFDRIDSAFERLADRLDKVDQRLDRLEQGLDRLEQGQNQLTKYLLDFREETLNRFEVIESRLEFLSLTLSSFESKFPALTKATLETGTFVTRITKEQSVQKELAGELAARLAKLEQKMNPAA